MVEKVLRRYGEFVGEHPKKLLLGFTLLTIGLVCGGVIPAIGKRANFFNEDSTELLWSLDGSKTQDNIRTWLEYGKPGSDEWGAKVHLMFFVNKGDDTKDIATKAALNEMFDLYRDWYTISVTTKSGKTFDTYDLCSRGNTPDDGSGFIAPCLVLSPTQCFREEFDVLPTMWQGIDPFIPSDPDLSLYYESYTVSKQEFNNMTDQQIKQTIGQTVIPGTCGSGSFDGFTGCWGHYSRYLFTMAPYMLGGGITYDCGCPGEITKMEGMMIGLMYDAAPRVQIRMSVTRPDVNKHEIDEARKLHSKKWNDMVKERAESMNRLEAVSLSPWWEDDLEEEFEDPMKSLILSIVGGILMYIYCGFALANYTHPMTSRCNLGFNGLGLVGQSQIMAWCFYLIIGFRVNPPMMMSLPFLALGLGVDDMFVYIRYFSELGFDFIATHTHGEIIGEVLAQAGPGTTLTSFCNIAAFSCGALLPVKAMSDLCICAAMICFMNWFSMLVAFMPLVYFEISRIQSKLPDPHPMVVFCHRRMLANETQRARGSIFATSTTDHSNSIEKRFISKLRNDMAPSYMKTTTRLFLIAVCVGLWTLSAIFVSGKNIGYNIPDLIPSELEKEQRAMEIYFDKFTYFPTSLVIFDEDIPRRQLDILDVLMKLGQVKLDGRPVSTSGPNWLNDFGQFAVFWAPMFGLPGFSWTNVTHPLAPYGLTTNDPTNFYALYDFWKNDPYISFLADFSGVNEFNHEDVSGQERVKLSTLSFSLLNLNDQADFITVIQKVQDVIDASPVKDTVFAYGPIFSFWEVFIPLEQELMKIFFIDVALIFFITLALLRSPAAATTSTLMCASIVFEIYGISCSFLDFNIFMASNALMSMGITVEFTAHVAAAFAHATGTTEERLATAMCHTFPATMEGAISSALCLIPLFWGPIPFLINYFCVMLLIMIGIGLFNGIVLLPIFLSITGSFGEWVTKMRGKQPASSKDGAEEVDAGAAEEKGDATKVVPTEASANTGAKSEDDPSATPLQDARADELPADEREMQEPDPLEPVKPQPTDEQFQVALNKDDFQMGDSTWI